MLRVYTLVLPITHHPACCCCPCAALNTLTRTARGRAQGLCLLGPTDLALALAQPHAPEPGRAGGQRPGTASGSGDNTNRVRLGCWERQWATRPAQDGMWSHALIHEAGRREGATGCCVT